MLCLASVPPPTHSLPRTRDGNRAVGIGERGDTQADSARGRAPRAAHGRRPRGRRASDAHLRREEGGGGGGGAVCVEDTRAAAGRAEHTHTSGKRAVCQDSLTLFFARRPKARSGSASAPPRAPPREPVTSSSYLLVQHQATHLARCRPRSPPTAPSIASVHARRRRTRLPRARRPAAGWSGSRVIHAPPVPPAVGPPQTASAESRRPCPQPPAPRAAAVGVLVVGLVVHLYVW